MWCVWAVGCLSPATEEDIKLGVILPLSGSYPWSLKRVLPAIDLAVETVATREILPNYNITVLSADSQCSEILGPLAAIDFHMNEHVNVLIGPVCDYAIAPVARLSAYWNVAVLSAGAWVQDFDSKTHYKLLTRVQGAYSTGADFILDVSHNFNWTRVGLLYQDNKAIGSGKSNCYFQMEALFLKLYSHFLVKPWHLSFDENQLDTFGIYKILMTMTQNTRGEFKTIH